MRARNLKPGVFSNEELGKLPFEYFQLFTGLWCYSDREGYFENRPEKISVLIFPYKKNIDGKKVSEMLKVLYSRGLIVMTQSHGYVPTFLKHNNPHPHEAKSDVSEEIKNTLKKLCNDLPLHFTACHGQAGLNPESCILNPESGLRTPDYPGITKGVKPGKPEVEIFFQGSILKIPTINHLKFCEAYPCVDIQAEYQKMDSWLLANPRSHKRDKVRFANNWLARCPAKLSGGNGENKKQAKEEEKSKRLEICKANVYLDGDKVKCKLEPGYKCKDANLSRCAKYDVMRISQEVKA